MPSNSTNAPLDDDGNVLPKPPGSTQPQRTKAAKKLFHVYSDEILTRLLIDLFMSRKEQRPNEEDNASSNK